MRVLILLLALLAAPAIAQTRQVTGVEAHEGAFRVTLSDGTMREREALTGMVLVYQQGDQRIRIRIAGIRPDPDDRTGRRLLHDFRNAATAEPLCQPAPDGTREGFPIAGRADATGAISPAGPGAFEIVCTSGAQGKCVRFGYGPWQSQPDGASMAEIYNACTHMVRADYCGLGEATTRNGMSIDVYDVHAIQKPENSPSQEFEAGWGPGGAVCVRHVRVKENTSLERLAATCPRLAGKLGEGCTEATARAAGAKLFNRSAP
ncbi:ADYC domain-containing protein [Bosea sp. 685]|uniref:ADYC domain-containing protein n=1 Tax=Bosea sp. 685 TaxID=3080057 RepID=UPI00289329A8|nr:ADYC domain-containing protein [Bosea sp. 685]WNJ92225.1 ADYC domain-containing protein [Bosea sp. 685]